MRWRAAVLFSCCLVTAREARAQTDSLQDRRAQLVQELPPGMRLRVQAGGERSVGRLRAVTADTLYIDNGAFATEDIQHVWIRQRSTRKGVKIGALIGAPVGAVFGGFVIWIANALCENSCGDLGPGQVALGAIGFGAFGLVSGGTIGAVIGAGLPRWGEITDKRTRVPDDPDAPIGSFAVSPAYAHFTDSDGGGVGAHAAYSFETRKIAVGFEAGRHHPGTTRQLSFTSCDLVSCFDTVDVKTGVFHVGAVARVKPTAPKLIEPYGILGVGFYSWDFRDSGSVLLGGYSVGTGVQLRNSTGRRGIFGEARYQSNLTRSGSALFTRYGFYTVGVGVTLAW